MPTVSAPTRARLSLNAQPKRGSGLGFDTMPPQDCLGVLEKIFERQLDGHQLIGQTSGEANVQWLNFRTVTNDVWHDGNIVLAGDAAHTTHFTIGSGTKLAIEDAIALADNLQRYGEIKPALVAYSKERQAAILQSQLAARLTAQWFENVPRYARLTPRQFCVVLRRRKSPLLPRLSPRLTTGCTRRRASFPSCAACAGGWGRRSSRSTAGTFGVRRYGALPRYPQKPVDER